MSDTPEQRAMATMQQAQRLVDQVTREIEDSSDRLKRLGVDPAKVKSYASANIPDDAAGRAQEQVSLDLAEIEDEVNRAKVGTTAEGASKAKRPRTMV